MKVKEIPVSLIRSVTLRAKSLSDLIGISKKEVPVVISLTTIESRLGFVDLVIRSLLDQTVKPLKIILWINENLKDHIPNKLSKMQNSIFEIKFTPLFSSHKKLIHTITLYSDVPIITCDDDLMYRKTWLEKLYDQSLKYPNTIIANQVRTIKKDPNGTFLPYSQWPVNSHKQGGPRETLAIGAEGVLYPPHSLDSRYNDEALFMKLAPKADDLWFKSMSLLKGTPCKMTEDRSKNAVPIVGSQKSSLKNINIKKDLNSAQWTDLVSYFDLDLGN